MMKTKVSWIQALAEEHVHLGGLLKRLRDLLSVPIDEDTTEILQSLLAGIAPAVRAHMQFEEKDGYMSPVQQCCPTLSNIIDELLDEHATLQTELFDIVNKLESDPGINELRDSIVPRVHRWLTDIRNHEIRENSLVQEAFNTDIGACD